MSNSIKLRASFATLGVTQDSLRYNAQENIDLMGFRTMLHSEYREDPIKGSDDLLKLACEIRNNNNLVGGCGMIFQLDHAGVIHGLLIMPRQKNMGSDRDFIFYDYLKSEVTISLTNNSVFSCLSKDHLMGIPLSSIKTLRDKTVVYNFDGLLPYPAPLESDEFAFVIEDVIYPRRPGRSMLETETEWVVSLMKSPRGSLAVVDAYIQHRKAHPNQMGEFSQLFIYQDRIYVSVVEEVLVKQFPTIMENITELFKLLDILEEQQKRLDEDTKDVFKLFHKNLKEATLP